MTGFFSDLNDVMENLLSGLSARLVAILGFLLAVLGGGGAFAFLGPENEWVTPLFGAGATLVVLSLFVRGRHGNIGVEAPVPVQVVLWGLAMFLLCHVPIDRSVWIYPWMQGATVLIVALGLATIFILSPGRAFPSGSFFWGVLCAWGASLLHWGLVGMKWAATEIAPQGPIAQASVAVAWVLGTVCLIVATVAWAIIQTHRWSKRDQVFFRLDRPGKFKAVRTGPTVYTFVGDLTGVPPAKESVPSDVLSQGPQAVWEWMCAWRPTPALVAHGAHHADPTILDNPRMDPRPFLNDAQWILPGAFFGGVPGFAIPELMVAEIFNRNHGNGGNGHAAGGHGDHKQPDAPRPGEYGTLQVIPDVDMIVGFVPTSMAGPEIRLKIGVSLRAVGLPYLFHVDSLDHQLEHAAEILGQALAGSVGTWLYGLTGHLYEFARRGAPRRPRTPLAPGDEPISDIPAEVGNHLDHFVHHMHEVGIHVIELRLKDVDLPDNIRQVSDERLTVFIQQTVAKAKADILRQTRMAEMEAFLDTAKLSDEKVRGDVVKELAKFYFIQGTDMAALLGVASAVGFAPGIGGGKKST